MSILIIIIIRKMLIDDYYYNYFLNYLIYSTLFLFLTLIIFFQKKKYFKLLFISIFLSSVAAIYMFEIYITFKKKNFINDLDRRQYYAQKTGISFDTRSKFQFISDLNNNGEQVIPTVPPNDILSKTKEKINDNTIFAVAGISNSKTVFCNESGKRIVYFSDRYGFRNKDQIWNNDKVDIAILGDSHVHGACVEDNDVTANLLSKILEKKVLNLGYQGHGPLMQLAALKEYAIKKKPKIVLWYYFESNDLGNMVDEILIDKLNLYRTPEHTQNLISNQKMINKQLLELIKFGVKIREEKNLEKKRINWINIVKMSNLRESLSPFLPVNKAVLKHRYSPIDPLEEYFKLLNIAIKTVNSWKGELYFVYHPHPSRYTGTYTFQYGERQYKKFLKRLGKLKVKTIDLKKDLFDKVGSSKELYHFGIAGHPSENGYKITAEYLAKILENE